MSSVYRICPILLGIMTISFCAAAQNEIMPTDSVTGQLFSRATILLTAGKFSESIPLYEEVLERNMQTPTLSQTDWHDLIENLGAAYGITGDPESAEKTLRYGLSMDSTYPLFHYNLACVYAERHDRDGAITSLKLGYKHRAHMPDGEPFPNPRNDDSFRGLINDPQFRAAIDKFEEEQSISKVEYSGPPLSVSRDYVISQLGGGSTILTIGAPQNEDILLNLYDSEGRLEVTLYKGKGGVMAVSVALALKNYGFDLKRGTHRIILFGRDGKAELSLNWP